jgi:hypothetical protein
MELKSPAVWPLDSFAVFYRTRRFITAFTKALHLFLSWASTHHPSLSLQDPSECYLPTYILIFLAVSFFLAFVSINYMRSYSPTFVTLHGKLFSLITNLSRNMDCHTSVAGFHFWQSVPSCGCKAVHPGESYGTFRRKMLPLSLKLNNKKIKILILFCLPPKKKCRNVANFKSTDLHKDDKTQH